MLKKTGVPSAEDVKAVYPSKERMAKGPVAIIECFQNIPCNPCATSCPQKAIREFEDINDMPDFDPEACNGCSICVANCPGLAIFVVDDTFSDAESLLKLPYEFSPLPKAGQEVELLDRSGQSVGRGRVHRVQNPPSFDKTAVIQVIVPKGMEREVRFIKRGVQ
jgi:Fe-S-cluster-containing hydrogenase component 2